MLECRFNKATHHVIIIITTALNNTTTTPAFGQSTSGSDLDMASDCDSDNEGWVRRVDYDSDGSTGDPDCELDGGSPHLS